MGRPPAGPVVDWGVGHYERTAEVLLPAAQVLVDVADPRVGERVLDVGSGTGNVALVAAAVSWLLFRLFELLARRGWLVRAAAGLFLAAVLVHAAAPLFIRACPGAGKTRVLVDRHCLTPPGPRRAGSG